ncbi:MAG: PriCT-2 domain-containing protein [Magnetococcales bacterium]|nr:PriCT-2 domain-containing protein [Magnetococcales bacterium]
MTQKENPPWRAAGNTTNSPENFTPIGQNRQGSPLEEIESALNFLSPDCEREIWVKAGMALKDGLGENGFQVFDSWSAGGASYNQADCHDVWRSIKPGGGITSKTLFKMAYESGWRWENKRQTEKPSNPQPNHGEPPGDKPHPGSQEPSTDFPGFLAKCRPADPSHAYLVEKGNPPNGALQHGENLIIPVQTEFGGVAGVQKISPDGSKRFAKGTQKRGNFFLIGATLSSLENQKLLVCEVFAKGSSLHQATGHPVAVAFDAGNLSPVTEVFRRRFPEAEIVVCGDFDGNETGQKAACQSAIKSQAKVALPTFTDAEMNVQPGRKPPSDWNDFYQYRGTDAVKKAIESAQFVESEPDPSEQCNQPTRQELATLIEATEDFDILTEGIAKQVMESGLPEPAILSLLKMIAKKCHVSVASFRKETLNLHQTQRNDGSHLGSALKVISVHGGKENIIHDGHNTRTWDKKKEFGEFLTTES